MSDDDGDGLDEQVGELLKGRFQGDEDKEADEAVDSEVDEEDVESDTDSESTASAESVPGGIGDPEGGSVEDVGAVELPADTPVREWDQYTMLLPPELADAVEHWFKRLNAERTLDEKTQLAKNEDFNLALVRYLLAEMDDEDVLQYAGIEE